MAMIGLSSFNRVSSMLIVSNVFKHCFVQLILEQMVNLTVFFTIKQHQDLDTNQTYH